MSESQEVFIQVLLMPLVGDFFMFFRLDFGTSAFVHFDHVLIYISTTVCIYRVVFTAFTT